MSSPIIELHQTSKSGKKLERIFHGPANGRQAGILIDVDRARRYQPFLGIGGAMNDATNYNLSIMTPEQREGILASLFDPKTGAGWNFVRISIGASDFSNARYSLSDAQNDVEMRHFNIDHDLKYNIPTFKRIQEINPDTFFFAAPWSPPAWMKDCGSMVGPGGKLLKQYYGAFARYMVKFIQAYADHGIKISAISMQNEVQGDHFSKPMPQCLYEPEEEAELIVKYFAPVLKASRLDTKIWIMDHNWLMGEYAIKCLEHMGCKSVVDGVAWHCYEGAAGTVNHIRKQYPALHNYFTEGNTSSGWGDYVDDNYNALETIFRNSHESYATWVTVLDEMGGPGEGPFIVNKESDKHGMINYHRKTGKLTIHTEHYKIAHIGKFVKRGATRIFTNNEITNVAFENPDGSIAIYINHNKKYVDTATFQIGEAVRHSVELEPHSYYTLVIGAVTDNSESSHK